MRTLRSHVTVSHVYGRSDVNGCLLTDVYVMSVAYRHGFKREILAFWLFRYSVKSDLMSNNQIISKGTGK